MKVIFISREGYSLPGARIRCYNFASALSGYGIETEVISYKDHLGAKDGQEEDHMEDTHRIWYNLKALRKISRSKDAVLYIQRIHYHYLAPVLAHNLFANNIILDVDDWDIGYNPFKRLSRMPKLKGEYLTRKIAQISAGCVASSLCLKQYISAMNPNTVCIPTAVDTSCFYPRPYLRKNGNIVFSWTGTVFREDNVENLIFAADCFARLNKKHPDMRMDIAGGGPRAENVKEVIRLKYPGANIRFTGWIPPSGIPEYLAGVDIGLFPLIQNTKFNLSKSPTKLFEYMAMGKAVVASNIGEAASVIRHGETGLLAGPGDTSDFTEKMETAAADGRLREKLGKNAAAEAEKAYSLKKAGYDLYTFIRKSVNIS